MTGSRQRLLFLSFVLLGFAVTVSWALGGPGSAVQAVQEEPMAITLSPATWTVDPEGSVQLRVDAGNAGLGFARVELLFDPAVLTLESFETTPLLSRVTTSTRAEANATGRIVLALRAEDGSAASGTVELATLRFSAATDLPEQRATLAVDPAHVQLVSGAGTEPIVSGATVQLGVNPAEVSCLGVADLPLTECEGLRSFYSSSGGGEWGNWFSSDSACQEWDGVTCTGGHVTGLDLAGLGIRGTLSPALAELTRLELLNLAENALSGPLPPELAMLSELRFLNLRANRLEGPIPPALSALAALEQLDLGYNMLSTASSQLATFLDERDPDWRQTQTVPPAGLAVAAVASSEIALVWEPMAYAPTGAFYEVYVAHDIAGPYFFHGRSAAISDSRYTAGDLTPNTPYFFKLRTYVPAATLETQELFSRYSHTVDVTTPLPPPSGVSASSGSDPDAIHLQWDTVAGASAYEIYRAASLSGTKTKLARETGTAFVDRTAAAGNVYFYWLSTCTTIGCSELSPVVYGWRQGLPALYVPLISSD